MGRLRIGSVNPERVDGALVHRSARFSYAITSLVGGVAALLYVPPIGVGGAGGFALKAALVAGAMLFAVRSMRVRVMLGEAQDLVVVNLWRTHHLKLVEVANVEIKHDFFQPGVWVVTVGGQRIRAQSLAAVRGLWKPGFPHPAELRELEAAGRTIARWAGLRSNPDAAGP
jgi:hypothetical protein